MKYLQWIVDIHVIILSNYWIKHILLHHNHREMKSDTYHYKTPFPILNQFSKCKFEFTGPNQIFELFLFSSK
jgi:hypothetical protein